MARAPGISIDASPGRIVLRDQSFFAAEAWHCSKSLLGRLLAMPAVAYVQVDRHRGTADIRLDPRIINADEISTVLREFSELLRSATTELQVHESYRSCQKFGFIKLDNAIVAGEIRGVRSGETSLAHPLLQGKSGFSLVVKRMLEWEQQISHVTILPNSGDILVQHESGLTANQLLILLERTLCKVAEAAHVDDSKRSLMISAACVALAIPAEFLLTGMIPFVAATLVVVNLKTLGRGMLQLLTLRWQIPALYTVIMGTTLISGQVLAAALMQASIAGWYCWSNRRLRQLIENLLSDAKQDSNLGFVQTEVPPYTAELPNHNDAESSDCVRLDLNGGREPLQQHLMKSLARVSSNHVANERCHDQASRFIPFTFATGVAAIATADVATLAAVLRPDFSTGPSISEQISAVAVMTELLQQGWLVSHPEALARFVAAEKIILFHPDDSLLQSESDKESQVSEFNLNITPESWQLANAKVTIEVENVVGSLTSCAAYARHVAMSMTGTVLCGPSNLINVPANSSVVRIATDSYQSAPVMGQADFMALSETSSVSNLCDAILSGTLKTRNGWSIILTCNLASVLGAFIVGLTSLHVVALTNFGTWAAFTATTRLGRSKETRTDSHESDSDFAHQTTTISTQRVRDVNQTILHL